MRILHPLGRVTLLALLGVLASMGRASADEVVLAGGTRLQGVVLEHSPERVRLLLPSGGELALAAADVKEVVPDADAPKGDQVSRYGSGPKVLREGLEVAVIHYVHPETGRRVDVVGAVHIGDMAYYREVQKILEDADVVLYELVKPQDGKPGERSEEPSPLRDFQAKMARWFDFSFQLDGISYDRPHFVHADMTIEEFSAAAVGLAKARDAKAAEKQAAESKAAEAPAQPQGTPEAKPPVAGAKAAAGAKLKVLVTGPRPAPAAGSPCPGDGRALPGAPQPAPAAAAPEAVVPPAPLPQQPAEGAAPKTSGAKPTMPPGLEGLEGQIRLLETMLKAMGIEDEKRGPKVRRTVKAFLGRILGSMGAKVGTLLGEGTSELLIVKRNEVAARCLAEVPAGAKTVAIFYGAAHLPDLEPRILALGYQRVGARWLLAWDMSDAAAAKPAPR